MHLINRLVARTFVPLTLLATAFAAACSSDQNGGGPGDGGPDATASGGKQGGTGGGSSTGGTTSTGGKSTGGASGSAGAGGSAGKPHTDGGTPDATAPDGGGKDAQVDAGPGPEAVLCADAGAPTRSLLVGGTTFCKTCTTSEVAAVDVGRGCVLGRTTFSDTDTVPRVSGGQGFVLQRTKGVLSLVSPLGEVTSSIELEEPRTDGGASTLNPHDVVYVSANGGSKKAFVSLYGASTIAVVNLDSGRVTSHVDLSSLHDPGDSDGSSDPDVGFYDPASNRVYFVLQRQDIFSGKAPSYVPLCPPVPSVLVAIDATTDKLVDLNGGADGVALPLSFVAPAAVAFVATPHRAIIMSQGCADTMGKRVKAGMESVDLDVFTVTTLLTSTSGFLSDLEPLSPNNAIVTSYDDNFMLHDNLWGFASTQLGAELLGVPDMPVAESANEAVGVAFEAEPRVKRFHVVSKTTTTLVSSPWAGVYTTSTGNALFP